MDWMGSEIRIWLNNSFIDASFSENETYSLLYALESRLELYEDKVFLLSKDEVKSFKSEDNFPNDVSTWWLRTRCLYMEQAVYAACYNGLDYIIEGHPAPSSFGVRPALNLNSSSVLFTTQATGKTRRTSARFLEIRQPRQTNIS